MTVWIGERVYPAHLRFADELGAWAVEAGGLLFTTESIARQRIRLCASSDIERAALTAYGFGFTLDEA